MFDVFLALVFLRALAISAWRRFPAGLLGGGAGALLWLGLAASGWYGRGADGRGGPGVLLFVFLGPSSLPAGTPRVPWSALLSSHPVAGKLAVALLFSVPFVLAWRRGAALSPLSDASSASKKLALVYLVPLLLVTAQALCMEAAELAPEWV